MSQRNEFFTRNATEDSHSLYKDFPEFKAPEAKEIIMNKPTENMRLYVTLKKSTDSNIEYKKMILMISSFFIKNLHFTHKTPYNPIFTQKTLFSVKFLVFFFWKKYVFFWKNTLFPFIKYIILQMKRRNKDLDAEKTNRKRVFRSFPQRTDFYLWQARGWIRLFPLEQFLYLRTFEEFR